MRPWRDLENALVRVSERRPAYAGSGFPKTRRPWQALTADCRLLTATDFLMLRGIVN